jgi:hypothetical protein
MPFSKKAIEATAGLKLSIRFLPTCPPGLGFIKSGMGKTPHCARTVLRAYVILL